MRKHINTFFYRLVVMIERFALSGFLECHNCVEQWKMENNFEPKHEKDHS